MPDVQVYGSSCTGSQGDDIDSNNCKFFVKPAFNGWKLYEPGEIDAPTGTGGSVYYVKLT